MARRHTEYDPDAPKVTTTLWLNPDLVKAAKSQGLDLSQIAEAALDRSLRGKEREAWRRENASAIAAYNESIESRALFSERHRRF